MKTYCILNRVASLLSFGLLVMLLGLGCSDDKKDTVVDAGTTLSVISLGSTGNIGGLDPSTAYDDSTWTLFQNIGAGLYRFKVSSTAIEPALAVAMPQKSTDGKEYTIQIKPGIFFADGTEVTAESFRYAYTRPMAIHQAMLAAGEQGIIVNWLRDAHVEDVVVVDKYTVKYVLRQPFAFFTSLLCQAPFMPLNPSFFPADKVFASPFQHIEDQAAWDKFRLNQNTAMDVTKLMGIGPYRVASISHDAAGGQFGRYTQIELVANPQYYGTPPKNDAIVLKYYEPGPAIGEDLTAGTLDVAFSGIGPEEYEPYNLDPNFNVYDASGVNTQLYVIGHHTPPFDNLTLRQALAFAADREAVTTGEHQNTAIPLYSPIPNGMWSHIDAFPTRDLEKAKELLNGLEVTIPGATDGGVEEEDGGVPNESFIISPTNKLAIDYWFPDFGGGISAYAEGLKKSLEETDLITVTLKYTDWINYLNQLLLGQMAFYEITWFPDYVDPDTYVFHFGHSLANPNGYNNPQMDQLIEQAQTTTDDTLRTALYEEIQLLWAEDVVTIPMTQIFKFFVAQKNIQLIPSSTSDVFYFEYVERVSK